MILLDTNVLSALMQGSPDRFVVKWLDDQPRSSIWTTSITVLEIRFGLQILPLGRKRKQLAETFERMLAETFEGRIAPFDTSSARHAAALMAERRKRGRVVDLRDTMIAGIALNSRATVATRNVVHFDDLAIPVISPWSRR